jgi:arylsulfatase A-like enzyme
MSSIVVTVDALRADHMAQFGYHRDTFPVADELAEPGTAFTQAYANGTNTGISLPSILTSRYQGTGAAKTGPTVASALPDDVTTIGIHSNTYFATRVDRPKGFDDFEDFDILVGGESRNQSAIRSTLDTVFDAAKPVVDGLGVRAIAERVQETVFPPSLIHDLTPYEDAERTTNRTLELLSTVDGEFFVWVHYMDPHRPYGIDLSDPAFTDSAEESEIRQLMSKAGVRPENITEREHDRIVDLYDSDVRYTSTHVARLFEGLRDRGLWADTDVILTADHGEEFGDHGFYYHRNRPYDELIHVPLYIKLASEEDERDDTVSDQRELLDVAPTVCSLHDVSPPASFEGTDLFVGEERTVVARGSFRDDGPVVGVRRDDWKYIDTDHGSELFNLVSDPKEQTNVAEDHPDQRNQLAALVPASAVGEEDVDDPRPDRETVSQEVADRLQQLGYTE